MKTLKEIGLAIVCILIGIALTQMDQEAWYPLAGVVLVISGIVIAVFAVIGIIKNMKK